MLQSAPGLEPHKHKLLVPTMHFQLGPAQVKSGLAEMARRLGVTRRASDRAVDAAYAAQRVFQELLLDAGKRALETLEETGEPGLVLLGRSYNIYDRSINCDIPRKLRHRYGANVIPLDFLATGRESVSDLHANMFWASGPQDPGSGAHRGRASRICTWSTFPISSAGPIRTSSISPAKPPQAPLLVLQFDGHGNDAGYMTRCEAYLDSKGILRCYQ